MNRFGRNLSSIKYNFKFQMPSFDLVTTNCCTWRNCNYCVKVTLLPNKVKSKHQILKFEEKINFLLKSIHVPFLGL